MKHLGSKLGLLVLVAFGAFSGARDARADGPATVFQLLTGYAAKEGCSCVFVVGQTDSYCTAFAQAAGLTTTVTIDHTAQTLSASAAGTTRTARVVKGGGCQLDGL